MPYQAILFDLDGTLVDSLQDIATAMNLALAECGFPTHALDGYKPFVGDGVEMLARRALPEPHRDPDTVHAVVTCMRKHYSAHGDDTTRPYAGIPELLDALSARDIPMAILSNKPDEITRRVVARRLAGWSFTTVRGARSEEDRKPDPRVALRIAARTAVPAPAWLFLGDTRTDVLTALAAGMYPVGATWGFRSREELLEAGAERLVEHPNEVLDLL